MNNLIMYRGQIYKRVDFKNTLVNGKHLKEGNKTLRGKGGTMWGSDNLKAQSIKLGKALKLFKNGSYAIKDRKGKHFANLMIQTNRGFGADHGKHGGQEAYVYTALAIPQKTFKELSEKGYKLGEITKKLAKQIERVVTRDARAAGLKIARFKVIQNGMGYEIIYQDPEAHSKYGVNPLK